MSSDHLGFVSNLSAVSDNVFIPKYYDPTISARLDSISGCRQLYRLGDLIDDGHIDVRSGHEVGKMAYGTGSIPFVRTSDLANWEVKTEPKQGISRAIYDIFAGREDVEVDDVLFVRDGTYLVGTSAMVTEFDTPLVYQSHILRLKTLPSSPISSSLLLAALSSPIVKLQIRARQFTADIIDTIGNRYRELMLPVPRDVEERREMSHRASRIIGERVRLREQLSRIPYWAQSIIPSLDCAPPQETSVPDVLRNLGFTRRLSEVSRNVFIPKYYEPSIADSLNQLKSDYQLLSLADLVEKDLVETATGIEVGKMAYGTGPVPFIRTSDMSNWELKGDPKQRVSEALYQALKKRTDVQAEDIFVVRDGTYLVGSSGIVASRDAKALYCGGLYKLRCLDREYLDPYLLLALLNMPIVRLQMKSKQFTRDIIDTIGRRIFEIVLPVPRDARRRLEIARETRQIVETRASLRDAARQLAIEIEGVDELDAAEQEIVEVAPL